MPLALLVVPTLYVLVGAWWDVAARRIPHLVHVPFVIAGACWIIMGEWSWSGVVTGVGLSLLGELPGGDTKALGVLGGFVGPVAMALGIAAGMTWCVVALTILRQRKSVPFFAVAGSIACASLWLCEIAAR